jgi:alpha-ketoglutarate-dependent taurine dioxygenase
MYWTQSIIRKKILLMTNEIIPTPYPGFQYIKDNLSVYVDRFLTGEIIAFRGANCSESEQQKLMTLLGDALGWWPNSLESDNPFYYETHHRTMSEERASDKSSMMLGWHLEHVTNKDLIYVSALWCMNNFKCDPQSGTTLFVDVVKIFESLPEEDRVFLEGIIVEATPVKAGNAAGNDTGRYKFIAPHWVLGIGVPRPILTRSHDNRVVSLHGKEPSEEESHRFDVLCDHIIDQVISNEDIRYVHSWEEGDMLLLDIFRNAHAVTGGFNQGDRTLTGIFGLLRYLGEEGGNQIA